MILVLPDIHGRTFWKKKCQDITKYDRVIFLGDYFDPYAFEDITVKDAIKNFKEILELKKNNFDKVVLLLGNHDMPYYSQYYYNRYDYHCRHSKKYHDEISNMFDEHHDWFKLVHIEDNIVFSHAGIREDWIKLMNEQFHKNNSPVIEIKEIPNDFLKLNNILNTKYERGLGDFVSMYRGSTSPVGSCVWADVHEHYFSDGYNKIKQVFGHTLQATCNSHGEIFYCKPLITNRYMMLDNCKAYELDTKTFKISV